MENAAARFHFEQTYAAWQAANQRKSGHDIGEFEYIEMLWAEYCIARDRYLRITGSFCPSYSPRASA